MKILAKLLVGSLLGTTFTISVANVSSAQVPHINWSQTCSDEFITRDGLLIAECLNMSGYPEFSGIDTNDFIGNIDGTLMSSESSGNIPRQNWSGTCFEPSISEGVLSAVCLDQSGVPKETSINTNDFIGNINGSLMTDLY